MPTTLRRLGLLAGVGLLAACSRVQPQPSIAGGPGLFPGSLPTGEASTLPVSAGPDLVLETYLAALLRGDCSAGPALGLTTFRMGNGELCGATTVTSYRIDGAAPSPFTTEVVFATTLVTTGTEDGSVQPGSLTWFYDLKRQADGAWRLVGGGSGP